MEVKSAHVAVVAADTAASSRLSDQCLLDPTTPARHSVRSTALTAVVTLSVSQNSLSPWRAQRIVTVANPARLTAWLAVRVVSVIRLPRAPCVFKPYLIEPMPDRRLASTDGLGDLSDRRPLLDQHLQFGSIQTPARSVLPSIDSLKPMLIHPVGDRRFVPAEPPAHLRQRQSSPEYLLQ